MLTSSVVLSVIVTMIILGAGIMGLCIFRTSKILTLFEIESDRSSWQIMYRLMIFFLCGYSLLAYLISARLFEWVPLLTGMVFFLGALFVWFSVNVYYRTLHRFLQIQDKYRTAKENAETLLFQLQKVQQSQLQSIHRETMLALGQMVAGVAHEINNPVSFIEGNLSHVSSYTQNLLDLVATYASAYPNPDTRVLNAIAASDLEFIKTDFPNIITSMEVGASRISEIVQSLSSFSRLNEADFKKANIHEGIDSTLIILRHRLNSCGRQGKSISVIQEYGEIPKIYCNPRVLNQVFFHVINNAIDALNKKAITNTQAEDEIPTIRIRTSSQNNQINIQIIDNGCGISKEVCKNIFRPFFTTKPVGQGTGLGLSISHQIIVEQHGGTIKCSSIENQGAEFIITLPINESSKFNQAQQS
ncbi:two-component sensor histidine kinase [Calothrix sp. NIES-4071]|nr:two-component sensor histidine kinase [Calothrix sp. NIES-4071]BAZ59691.1 two-component sensor histidine kinase [Calothrix sp. NIES-4105]